MYSPRWNQIKPLEIITLVIRFSMQKLICSMPARLIVHVPWTADYQRYDSQWLLRSPTSSQLDSGVVRNSHKHHLHVGSWALKGGSPTSLFERCVCKTTAKWRDKRQTKRKTKTPNPLVLDRALSRCFVCWLVCLLVSCVFVCLSVCVCLFVSLLLGLFVCGCLFPCLLARLVCLWEREKEESRKRLLKLNVSQHPSFLFCLCFSLRVALFDSIAGLRKQKCKNDCCKK